MESPLQVAPMRDKGSFHLDTDHSTPCRSQSARLPRSASDIAGDGLELQPDNDLCCLLPHYSSKATSSIRHQDARREILEI